MAKKTKTVDGEALPKSAFAFTPTDDPADWKIPINKPSRIGPARAAMSAGGFRGQPAKIPASARAGVIRKINAAAKKFGVGEDQEKSSKHAIPIIKSADTLLREVTFIYYEPNVIDSQGDWASPEVIEKGCDNFNKNLENGNVIANLFHSKDDEGRYEETDSYTIQKSWIAQTDCIIGETEVAEGTWLVKVKMTNDILWDKFLDGTISGVSFGARGTRGE